MSNGRDSNGRFSRGNAGGPGRPPRALEQDYLAAIGDVVSVADWHEIVGRALADAKRGDSRARSWLSQYLVGETPAVSIEHRGVNIYVPSNGRFNGPPEGLREIEDDEFYGNAERLKAIQQEQSNNGAG